MILVRRVRRTTNIASCRRQYGFSLKSSKLRDSGKSSENTTVALTPARTRFAPSPTGSVHLGSLRTALYNYLWAKRTGGSFILRLEDTDRTRLVPGAEENIRETMKWAGLNWDEEYVQSARTSIYREYADQLLDKGHAYRCFCPKDRLDGLRESARKLSPPSMASYDRKCAHTVSPQESDNRANSGEPYTLRFKAPVEYKPFTDVLHGTLSLQTQTNHADQRYEDPVLLKSDGLPTYHLANVVDDHLMQISHVIRGEEWLLSAPKHAAIYAALGWKSPQYAHIPLLTSVDSDRKLSKREGDASVLAMAERRGILPEALVNFVALFGWAPPHSHIAAGGPEAEMFTMQELIEKFSLDGLTRGNAKVDDKKLLHFNQHFFRRRIADPQKCEKIIQECHDAMKKTILDIKEELSYTRIVFESLKNNINSTMDFVEKAQYFYTLPAWSTAIPKENTSKATTNEVLTHASKILTSGRSPTSELCETLLQQGFTKRQVFSSLRFALAGGVPGVKIPQILSILGPDRSKSRIDRAMTYL